MSNTKTVMSQAANTQGLPLDITDVFSTYLYEGDDLVKQITNGVDLDGEGGLVWIKSRDSATSPNFDHMLFDTERGATKKLASNTTASELTNVDTLTSFNSDGFTVDDDDGTNKNLENYASWTFRKAPKFFDVVTYTGDGVNGREIAHNLGSTPGMIIIKNLDNDNRWYVWHNSFANNEYLYLNETFAKNNYGTFAYLTADPTSTTITIGSDTAINSSSGYRYVAYLFAHNDGDGGFGPSGDQDIIKCGSFSTDTGANASVELGFEPQFLLIKRTDSTDNWKMVDVMRGMSNWDYKLFYPNLSLAEGSGTGGQFITPEATGFKTDVTGVVSASATYIYMAIRRGPLAPPESGTEVFAIDTQGSTGDGQAPAFRSTFPVDTAFVKSTAGGGTTFASRLTGTKYLRPEETSAEYTNTQVVFDYMNGFRNNTITFAPNHGYLWKRAPNFFDVVAYTGEGANTVINHNLDAIPEMVWVKNRGRAQNWNVYHKDLELNGDPASECRLFLNTDAAVSSGAVFWGTHTNTTFTMTVQNFQTNYPNDTYIAYLFATLDGISKVGSYTGNGTSQTIDCGFTSGARFILVKRTDSTGDWYVWDTERGIVAGNDPYLELNTTDAEVTSTDWVDPDNSGFIVNGTTINASSAEYIFYAIA